MKNGLILLLVGFVFAGAHTAVAQSAQSTGTGPLVITMRAVKDVVEAGAPVVVQVTVTNTSDHRMVYPGPGPLDKFDVRDSEGKPPLTRWGQAFLLGEGRSDEDLPRGSSFGSVVEPGKSISGKETIPADVFDLTKPGTYSIRIHMPYRGQMLTSNTVTVTVVEGATPYVPPVPKPPISVTIQTVGGASVFPGGKLKLEVITKDTSNFFTNQRTARDKRDLARFYRVDVHDSQGAIPPESDLGRAAAALGDSPPQWLGPNTPPGREDLDGGSYKRGEARSQVIAVDDLYDLSKPGQYTIQVRRWDDETKTWVRSNALTVTVTP